MKTNAVIKIIKVTKDDVRVVAAYPTGMPPEQLRLVNMAIHRFVTGEIKYLLFCEQFTIECVGFEEEENTIPVIWFYLACVILGLLGGTLLSVLAK